MIKNVGNISQSHQRNRCVSQIPGFMHPLDCPLSTQHRQRLTDQYLSRNPSTWIRDHKQLYQKIRLLLLDVDARKHTFNKSNQIEFLILQDLPPQSLQHSSKWPAENPPALSPVAREARPLAPALRRGRRRDWTRPRGPAKGPVLGGSGPVKTACRTASKVSEEDVFMDPLPPYLRFGTTGPSKPT